MSHPRRTGLTRRAALLAACSTASWQVGAAPEPARDVLPDARPATAAWAVRSVPASEPMRQLLAGGPSGLLGAGASGSLWALSMAGQAPRRLAEGLDAQTPVASGHGRMAARAADGGLWVWEGAERGGRVHSAPGATLAVHAGLLNLPLAVLGVVTTGKADGGHTSHRLARFEPDNAGHWREVARSQATVLPDARPLQVDLDGRGDGGHIAVLAGPDAVRYRHGVLGDVIEATSLLWLERHSLQPLRSVSLPAPHVFEDIAPRPVLLPGPAGQAEAAGLLTVRSGPDGAQLALVTADPNVPQALRLAALGDTVGGLHRWLAPTTDGHQLAAVHTPHIGGVLHVYRQEGQQLTRRRLAGDVSTHHIGSRQTDLAVWLQGRVVLPTQDGRRLRVLDLARDGAQTATVALPGRVAMTAALADSAALAVLLDDGRVVLVTGSSRAMPLNR